MSTESISYSIKYLQDKASVIICAKLGKSVLNRNYDELAHILHKCQLIDLNLYL